MNFLPTPASMESFAKSKAGKQLIDNFQRSLIWVSLLQRTYKGQPGEVLLASAHSQIIEIWALVPLKLVHSASGSFRTLMDLLFSYSYYLSHPKEWSAVCLKGKNCEGRASIIDWHLRFTPFFEEYNKQFGTRATLDGLQEELSCLIHGIPGEGLPMMGSLDRQELDKTDVTEVIDLAARVDDAMNSFLVGVFHTLLPVLSEQEYKLVLAGIDKGKLAACGIVVPSR